MPQRTGPPIWVPAAYGRTTAPPSVRPRSQIPSPPRGRKAANFFTTSPRSAPCPLQLLTPPKPNHQNPQNPQTPTPNQKTKYHQPQPQ